MWSYQPTQCPVIWLLRWVVVADCSPFVLVFGALVSAFVQNIPFGEDKNSGIFRKACEGIDGFMLAGNCSFSFFGLCIRNPEKEPGGRWATSSIDKTDT